MATARRPLTAANTHGRGRKFAYCLTRGTPIIGGDPVGSARRTPAKRRPEAGLALAATPPSVGSARAAFGLRAGGRFFLLWGCSLCSLFGFRFLLRLWSFVGLARPGRLLLVSCGGFALLVAGGGRLLWGRLLPARCGLLSALLAGRGLAVGSLCFRPAFVGLFGLLACLWVGVFGAEGFCPSPLFLRDKKRGAERPPQAPPKGGNKTKIRYESNRNANHL